MNKSLFFIFFFVTSASGDNSQTMNWNLTKGASRVSSEVYSLHMIVFYICLAILIFVCGLILFSIIRFHKSKNHVPSTKSHSLRLELLWTIIPFIILITMAVPATKTLISMEDTSSSNLTVLVTGSQWKWHYKYLDTNISFYSNLATSPYEISNQRIKRENYLLEVDNPLVIPINQKVRFLVTSDDVIHSWWVPDFAIKKDANPGFINEAWTVVNRVGTYRGQCAELCGKNHGFMPIVVIAKEQTEFKKWLLNQEKKMEQIKLEEQKITSSILSKIELMELGESVYIQYCSACHQINGKGLKGIFPKLDGSPLAIQEDKVREHINIVLYGKTGSSMQAYKDQLTLKEIAAVITYERNAWSNKTDRLVQPSEIKKYFK